MLESTAAASQHADMRESATVSPSETRSMKGVDATNIVTLSQMSNPRHNDEEFNNYSSTSVNHADSEGEKHEQE